MSQDAARKRYDSDLSDEQWEIIKGFLPPPKNQHGGRPRTVEMRDVINAILYINRTGCQRIAPRRDALFEARFGSIL